MTRLALIALLLAPSAACVMKSKYVELETEYQSTRASLESQLSERNQTILGLEGEVEALNGQVSKLKGDLAQKEAALNDLREQNTSMLSNQEGLKGEIDRMRTALEDLERRKAEAEARMKEFKDLVARFQKMIDAGTLDVRIVNGRMVVVLATDILFGSGSATLSKEGKAALSEVAAILITIPGRDFQIEGHTDNVPIANERFPSNWYLAAARSIGVVEHMVASGMPADRLSAASYGEFKPVDTNMTKEGKAKNRRIEIVVVPDLSQLPGFKELQGAR
jgi:chemotaxis protein MotB